MMIKKHEKDGTVYMRAADLSEEEAQAMAEFLAGCTLPVIKGEGICYFYTDYNRWLSGKTILL